MDQQTPATTPAAAPAQQPQQSQPADAPASVMPDGEQAVGFGSRGRLRRRARFLRKARELAYRDLGGLVFSLHRFNQRNDQLVLAKLSTLSRIDAELRALETSLAERQPVTVLREAGITACPRCAAIHSGEDRFCPGCGLPMSRRSDLPIAGAPTPSGAAPPQSAPAPVAPPAGPPPATQAHAIAQPGPPPSPPTQSFAPVAPATAQHASIGAPGQQPLTDAAASENDQPTEIIRPPAAGS
ncbi:MAG TPA: hypothetical protein VGF47_04555 [Solirubrobacteraceae bacterium]